MKNKVKIFTWAAAGLLLMSGCIKEIDPQSSSVTEDQANNAPGK